MTTVTVGGLTLDVADGVTLRSVTDLTGWVDGPPARGGLQPKAQQDGDWDATGTSGSRGLGIAGFVEEPSASAADAFLRQLTALRPQGAYDVTVTNAVGTLSTRARVTVAARSEWYGDRAFEYTLALTAPDPLLYGPPVFRTATLADTAAGTGLTYPLAYPLDYGVAPGVTPGALSLPNAGTAAYWPRLRIDGPVPNPVVTMVETGAWIRYNGTVLAGQWLDIDLANRRVLLQGQVSVRRHVSSSGDWLAVPVGGGSVVWTADAADPAATLSVWGYEMAVS